jgi:phage shock protein A
VRAHPRFREPEADETAARLANLEAQVSALQAAHTAARDQVAAVRRERDEYRGRAQRAQQQALLLNATVQDLEEAVRSLLAGLSAQSAAIAESLVPDTPADLQR